MQEKKKPKEPSNFGSPETDTPYRRKCRMTWAALIKAVYEIDPLKWLAPGELMEVYKSCLYKVSKFLSA